AYEILGEREAVVARELTKLHEEIRRGLLSKLAADYTEKTDIRGEIVVLIDRNVIDLPMKQSSIAALVDQFERDGMDHRAALKKAAREAAVSAPDTLRETV